MLKTRMRRPVVPLVLLLLGAASLSHGGVARADPSPTAPVGGSANAGAAPFQGQAMYRAFHETAGIRHVVDRAVDLGAADPRIADIFENKDLPHLKRMLFEQFCYLLNGPCEYTGKDMKTAHEDMGLRMSDFNALVEDLQRAMNEEGVAFYAQNRLLAKLAPMERVTVER